MNIQAAAIAFVSLTIADMERSLNFYTTVLGCQKTSDHEVAGVECDRLYRLPNVRLRVVQLQLGHETIELIEFLTPKGRPIPADSRSHDRWFQHLAIVVSDMSEAYQHLREHWVPQTSPNPQTLPEWNPVAGDIQSFYFKDLDGHNLELIHFPEGKGDSRWQQPTDALFLGIDHTAIVVADTAASRAFYCDKLGMGLQQESQNSGAEQERLSGVSDVQVQISSLKASTGIGLELLEYASPNGRRPMPADTHANDLWVCQTTIVAQKVTTAVHQPVVSSSMSYPVVTVSEPILGFKQGFLMPDPDGHLLRVVLE
ncbi:MAG: VOC family protein [Stenomitos rutilans HA7619-LM2]|jgi:catechol 2,3-dioxygenase-like lactoylglutathione lyase family enzyme|nr:VOC family protein [Stenomitos rutilans HA7619-LM2]